MLNAWYWILVVKSLFRSALERYNEEQITSDSEEEEEEENPEPDVLI